MWRSLVVIQDCFQVRGVGAICLSFLQCILGLEVERRMSQTAGGEDWYAGRHI